MKKIIFTLTIATLLFACKKKDSAPEIVGPKNYDEIKFSDIKSKEGMMNFQEYEYLVNDQIAIGNVFVFKTEQNRFGKLQILNIGNATSTYKLTFKVLLYDLNGNEKSTNSDIQIFAGDSYDFDLMVFSFGIPITADFQWAFYSVLNPQKLSFKPWNGAKFTKYTF
jgi:hypothetical protein